MSAIDIKIYGLFYDRPIARLSDRPDPAVLCWLADGELSDRPIVRPSCIGWPTFRSIRFQGLYVRVADRVELGPIGLRPVWPMWPIGPITRLNSHVRERESLRAS